MAEPLRIEPTSDQLRSNLLKAHRVAISAFEHGKHPFGAILVGPDHKTILLSQENINTVNHAESTLARKAADSYSPSQLWECTLYTTVEPCAMCAGTQYWANIGRLVYSMSERQLLDCTANHKENPTLDVPCRLIFEKGQKDVKIYGPIFIKEIAKVHQTFWSNSNWQINEED